MRNWKPSKRLITNRLFTRIYYRLIDLLDKFEASTEFETGVSHISGGFALADFDYLDSPAEAGSEKERKVHFTLKWGVQSDCEDTVHTEHYAVLAYTLLTDKSIGDIIREDVEDE